MMLAEFQAVERLMDVASGDSKESELVAKFLLAWANAAENGGWDPTDLWKVDRQVASDIVATLALLMRRHHSPADLGFESEIKAIRARWRT